MENRFAKRTKTAIGSVRFKNSNLPQINHYFGKTSIHFFKFKKARTKLASADFSKTYKLDYQKYRNSINLKKEKIYSLEKLCENLQDKAKFNDEIVKEILTENNVKTFNMDARPVNKRKINIIDINDKVKEYKIINKTVDNIKNEYIKGKVENKKIKTEIWFINEHIKETENNVQLKKNEILNLKNKIKIAEKNKKQKEEILDKKEEENNKLNKEIIKYFEKQIDINKNKLNEENTLIEKNTQLIEKLKIKLKNL